MSWGVYVSGPMSGIENFNRAAFEWARLYGERRGYVMSIPGDSSSENPTPSELAARQATTANRQKYLRYDMHDLLDVDEMWMLPGWRRSRGAVLEFIVAHEIGVPVFEFTEANTPAGSANNVDGNVYWAEVRDGIDGPIVSSHSSDQTYSIFVARFDATELSEPYASYPLPGATTYLKKVNDRPSLGVSYQDANGIHTRTVREPV